MSLLDFQIALGKAVRAVSVEDSQELPGAHAAESAVIQGIINSRGFHFTRNVQRSWSVGRASNAARLTLSHLPTELRERLLEEWVSRGGGTSSFFAAEAHAFLAFIARNLPDPSHERTLCEVEQASLRASEGTHLSALPDLSKLDTSDCILVRGQYAARVQFHTEPRLLFAALSGPSFPPLPADKVPVIFAPRFDGLFHIATTEEDSLWQQLAAPVAVTALLRDGHRRKVIEAMLLAGCADYAGPFDT